MPDFIYVEDLCRAIHLALQGDVSGEVFQIATGEETSILDLAAMVQEVLGQDIDMQHGPPRQGDIRKNYSAVEKVRRELGWESRVALADGLREAYAGWKEQVC